MKEFLSVCVIIGVLVSGCGKSLVIKDEERFAPTNNVAANIAAAKIGDTVVASNGRVYRKLSNESLANGAGVVDIWEQISPPNTNSWYTPTLSSRILGIEIEFNSLYRAAGEKIP